MREPRVYTDQPLAVGVTINLEPTATRHLLRVLRLRPGAPLRLFNGEGSEYQGRLTESRLEAAPTARVTPIALLHQEPQAAFELHLLLGVSRGERMDFALQKAVELGVTRFSPLLSRRSVVQLKGERLERRHQHWQQLVVAACEQSGRCRLPRLDPPQPLAVALEAAEGDQCLVLYHRGTTALGEIPPPARGITLLVGPEGGLEEGEIRQAQVQGFIPLRLGPRILRTETAPLAALAAIQALWGDFRAGIQG